MSLKTEIEKIFAHSTGYSEAIQAVNQASSLNSLSADLYTDSKRFIYELLQNADDSSQNNEAVKVWLKIFDDYLVFAHSGKPFNVRDLHGICNVDNGTKKQTQQKLDIKELVLNPFLVNLNMLSYIQTMNILDSIHLIPINGDGKRHKQFGNNRTIKDFSFRGK